MTAGMEKNVDFLRLQSARQKKALLLPRQLSLIAMMTRKMVQPDKEVQSFSADPS